ncbi:MAG: matrixin family metalloprotease [Candidatus Gastranaerophilales bacterium]|nr:matrixin family metalloprotease [Candidatus Gastranaerophilales bacterium]
MAEKETYLQYNLKDGRLIRWPDNCFPLTFYIAPFRWYRGRGEETKYYSMVQKAIQTWEIASDRKCRFQFVSNLNDSQINLEWKRVDRKSLGYCLFNFDEQARLYSAEVQIGLSDGILHAKYMDENEVYHTILHEIGHALGLGHSPYTNDIMYTPHQYGNVSLSRRDVNSIKWLYNLPLGASVNELNSRFRMNEKDIDVVLYHVIHSNDSNAQENVTLTEQKNLWDEQAKLAEIKKYQVMALQNIQISQNMSDFIKQEQIRQRIKKQKENQKNDDDN